MPRHGSTTSTLQKHYRIKVGDKIGRLTVISGPHRKPSPTESDPCRTVRAFVCRCECGNEKLLVSGHIERSTKSCGCLRADVFAAARKVSRPKHGHAVGGKATPEYKAWSHLRERCLNPDHPCWHNYGGRGITVSDAWNDFAQFIADMGRRPSPKHTIERVDNDKGYSKENCVWATRQQQAENRRTSIFHELNGEVRTRSGWARVSGVSQFTIGHRIKRGWSVEEAITKKTKHEKSPLIEYEGKKHTLFEWSQITGIDYRALHSRYKRGWNVFRMLNQPAQPRKRKV